MAEAVAWEPEWLKIQKLKLPADAGIRFVHFTDVHHKGDRAFLLRVIQTINELKPDFACFTGDLVEEAEFLPEALEIFREIKCPLYGIPGNHDYWADVDFDLVKESFSAAGGSFLMDQECDFAIRGTPIHLSGITCTSGYRPQPRAGAKNILLAHYPGAVDKFNDLRFDITLAGHSHGGQVRLPLVGALVLPSGVGNYDMGKFETPCGPLYVNPGIGYFYANVRFRCRPELTLFTM